MSPISNIVNKQRLKHSQTYNGGTLILSGMSHTWYYMNSEATASLFLKDFRSFDTLENFQLFLFRVHRSPYLHPHSSNTAGDNRVRWRTFFISIQQPNQPANESLCFFPKNYAKRKYANSAVFPFRHTR